MASQGLTAVRVTSEPRMYDKNGPHSFFRDLGLQARDRDPGAMERLSRHQLEHRVDSQPVDKEAREDALGVEYRINPTVALGGAGEFAPPGWMIPLFATAGRSGRALADVIGQAGNGFRLPAGVQAVRIPKITTGNTVGLDADSAAIPEQDMVTSDASSNVVTIAGAGDVSQQLFDQTPAPGIDFVYFQDLTKAYNKLLEIQLLTGTGSATFNNPGAQLNGITNISAIPASNIVDATGHTTIAQLWPDIGKVAGNVTNNRNLPPEALLMAGRRYFWIASSVDSQNRPLASPGQGPHLTEEPAAGGVKPFGPILGLPTYLDGAIPNGSNADTVYAVRPSDMFLWEGDPKFLVTVGATSGTLQVKISLHRGVAAILDRYPSGIGYLKNLAQPSGF